MRRVTERDNGAGSAYTITILLAEGRSDGLRLVTKSNWNGAGLICPRNRYSSVKRRDEFSRSGVYLLVGFSEDATHPAVYIGQGDVVRDRLNRHHAQKEFWQQAIVFTAQGDTLHKGYTQYLESKLIALAKSNGRCRLENSRDSRAPTLSAFQEAEVEGFLRELLTVVPVLGLDVFERLSGAASKKDYYVYEGKDWKGTGYVTSRGFTVRKGSEARASEVQSISLSYKALRGRLREEGVLEPRDGRLLFTRDYEFPTPSAAACTVGGHSISGREAWKDGQETSLKERQEREVGED